MKARPDPVAATRAAREAFEYALAHNLTVKQAEIAIARAKTDTAIAAIRAKRCGTVAPGPRVTPAQAFERTQAMLGERSEA